MSDAIIADAKKRRVPLIATGGTQRYLSEERQFAVPGERLLWQWTRA